MHCSAFAQMFFPLALWTLGSEVDSVLVRLFLRGIKRAFSTFSDDPRTRTGPGVLEVFSPLIDKLSYQVSKRILEGEELKTNVAVKCLFKIVGSIVGEKNTTS